MAVDFEKPAIVQRAPLVDVRFGLSYAVSRVGYDRITLPRDFRDATLTELLPWLPSDMRDLPPWALMGIIPGMGGLAGFTGSSGLNKTTVLFTVTSAANQTYSPVLSDWNSTDNAIYCQSHGGTGGTGGANAPSQAFLGAGGGGGGGGGHANKNDITLTPSGSMTYHLEDGGAGTATGQATWANGATLAASSVGICGATNGSSGTNGVDPDCCSSGSDGTVGAGGAGASTTGATGTNKFAGGVGGTASGTTGGGGGGAAGSLGAGGAASGTTPGTGTGASYDASHAPGAGGTNEHNGNAYGGGGGGGNSNIAGEPGGTGSSALIVLINNRSA